MTKREKMSRAQRRSAQQQSKQSRRLIGILAGVVVAAFFVYILWHIFGSPTLSAEDVPDPVLGLAAAPIEIVEYGDFGSPTCRGWHNAGVMAQVQESRVFWFQLPSG